MANVNPAMPPELQGLPPLSALVKPEQIPHMTHVTDNHKRAYIDGLSKYHATLRTNAPNSPAYIAAYKRLVEITAAIKKQIQTFQQNGTRPGSQGQPQAQETGQSTQQPSQNVNGQPISAAILEKVKAIPVSIPQNIESQGRDAVQNYVKTLKLRFADAMRTLETANSQLQTLESFVEQRQSKGEGLNANEQGSVNQKRQQLQAIQAKAKEGLLNLQQHQNDVRKQNQGRTLGPNGPNIKEENSDQKVPVSMPPQQPSQNATLANHTGQVHTVSSALDAVRSQQTGASTINHTQNIQQPNGPPPSAHTTDMSQQANRPQLPPTSQPLAPGIPVSQPPSSQIQNNNSTAATSGPASLPFPQAMDRSRQLHSQSSYPSNNASQPGPQQPPQQTTSSNPGASHAHPQIHSRIDTNPAPGQRMPIAREMKFEPPQPVAMGPSRPTLTGGPSNMNLGSMGAPALSKHPGYVLGAEGERVLSKKKLRELVRQVTGGNGLDGEEELDPKVEEVRPNNQALVFCNVLTSGLKLLTLLVYRHFLTLRTLSSTMLPWLPAVLRRSGPTTKYASVISKQFWSDNTISECPDMGVMRCVR